ncbi:MAG: HAMP domain-containing histidine kinase [Halobacteriovoraceae bacterium]|nr:HAMP domain-containing histidine kinase [Halobacteriovoraceae bacterium]
MELNKQKIDTIQLLAIAWSFFLFLLGGWWIYLLFSLGDALKRLAEIDSSTFNYDRFTWMIKWEGGVFFAAILIISIALFYLIQQDRMRNKSIQKFFAAMTHELKTPLASVRLQAEVLEDTKDQEQTKKLINRLIDDTKNLETQLDKVLQLSRLELDGNFNLVKVEVNSLIELFHKRWAPEINVQMVHSDNKNLLLNVDEFALELIFRNLFENTKRYSQEKKCKIELKTDNNFNRIFYTDSGDFKGEKDQIGTLFYKHNSKKGSGIGLYLIDKLMSKMHGDMKIKNYSPFCVELIFPKSTGASL